MTNIELLKHIKNAPSFMGGDTRYEATTNGPDLYLEDIAQIENALSVAEKMMFELEIMHNESIDKLIRSSDTNDMLRQQAMVWAITELESLVREHCERKEWLENGR